MVLKGTGTSPPAGLIAAALRAAMGGFLAGRAAMGFLRGGTGNSFLAVGQQQNIAAARRREVPMKSV
jgi:hypothetical protein